MVRPFYFFFFVFRFSFRGFCFVLFCLHLDSLSVASTGRKRTVYYYKVSVGSNHPITRVQLSRFPRPRVGETNVDVDTTQVSVTFNEAMDTSASSTAGLTLSGPIGLATGPPTWDAGASTVR